MADSDDYTVLMLVEAETPQLAREEAVKQLVVLSLEGYMQGYSLSYIEPLRTNSDEGSQVAHSMWHEYIVQNIADLEILTQTLAPHMQSDDPPLEILDDWGFRSACLRIGTIDSWPIRIYHMGIGVNNSSILNGLMLGDSMWVVTAQVK
jgi:hypothetical protein